jgi:hypothetical protein
MQFCDHFHASYTVYDNDQERDFFYNLKYTTP